MTDQNQSLPQLDMSTSVPLASAPAPNPTPSTLPKLDMSTSVPVNAADSVVSIGGKPVNLRTGEGAVSASQSQARPTAAAAVVKPFHGDAIDVLAEQTPMSDRINKGLKEGVEAGFGLHDIDASEHPYMDTLQQTWENLKNGAHQSYARMGGAPGVAGGKNPSVADKAVAGALTPVDMLASGIEGMSNLIDSGSREMLAGAKSKDPQTIARGFAKMMSGVGQAVAGSEVQDAPGSAADAAGAAAKEAAGKVSDVADRFGANRAASKAADAQADYIRQMKQAAPPVGRAKYADADAIAVKPLIEAERPSVSTDGIAGTHEALKNIASQIEDRVSEEVAKKPNAVVPSLRSNVQDALKASGSKHKTFVTDGMSEFDHYEEPKNLREADDLRRELNTRNKAVLAKNMSDQYTASVSDPGFAARQAYADALRDVIYNELPGMRDLRQLEGSVIRVKNAFERQLANGEKVVRGSAPESTARNIAGKTAKGAAAMSGVALGSATGFPAGGYFGGVLGSSLGSLLEKFIKPSPLTRDELANKASGLK